MQVDDEDVPLLGARGRRGARTGLGAGQLPGVPEVADAAGHDQGEDHDQGDDPAACAALGLLAALGAVLGELQPVDDVLGVAVRLLDEGELLGAVLPFGRLGVRGRTVVIAVMAVMAVGLGSVVGRAGLLRDVRGLLGDPGLLSGTALRALPVGIAVGVAVGVVRGGRRAALGAP